MLTLLSEVHMLAHVGAYSTSVPIALMPPPPCEPVHMRLLAWDQRNSASDNHDAPAVLVFADFDIRTPGDRLGYVGKADRRQLPQDAFDADLGSLRRATDDLLNSCRNPVISCHSAGIAAVGARSVCRNNDSTSRCDRRLLRCRIPIRLMTALGHKQTSRRHLGNLPLKADIASLSRHVR